MDNQLKTDLENLQVRLRKELSEALPPNLAAALDDLIFIMLYQNLKEPTESGTAEARRLLNKYRKLIT